MSSIRALSQNTSGITILNFGGYVAQILALCEDIDGLTKSLFTHQSTLTSLLGSVSQQQLQIIEQIDTLSGEVSQAIELLQATVDGLNNLADAPTQQEILTLVTDIWKVVSGIAAKQPATIGVDFENVTQQPQPVPRRPGP